MGREFEQMPVGIAKVDAAPTARPFSCSFDPDMTCAQMLLPLREFFRANGKCHMQGAAAVMRRDCAAGHFYGFERSAPPEKQERTFASYIVCTHTVVAVELRK